jgi:carbamoylphosphate synthase small subunit
MAILALEDGTIFHGESVGADGTVCAEVVFNTALTGYQEIITDPSYRGQMITFTCTHVGNVGVNDADNESARPQCAAILARDIVRVPSNWRAQQSSARLVAPAPHHRAQRCGYARAHAPSARTRRDERRRFDAGR